MLFILLSIGKYYANRSSTCESPNKYHESKIYEHEVSDKNVLLKNTRQFGLAMERFTADFCEFEQSQ